MTHRRVPPDVRRLSKVTDPDQAGRVAAQDDQADGDGAITDRLISPLDCGFPESRSKRPGNERYQQITRARGIEAVRNTVASFADGNEAAGTQPL